MVWFRKLHELGKYFEQSRGLHKVLHSFILRFGSPNDWQLNLNVVDKVCKPFYGEPQYTRFDFVLSDWIIAQSFYALMPAYCKFVTHDQTNVMAVSLRKSSKLTRCFQRKVLHLSAVFSSIIAIYINAYQTNHKYCKITFETIVKCYYVSVNRPKIRRYLALSVIKPSNCNIAWPTDFYQNI